MLEVKHEGHKRPNIYIYHHNDADGYASAAIIKRMLLFHHMVKSVDKAIECQVCAHEIPMKHFEEITTGDILFIVDYSFSNPIDHEYLLDLFTQGVEIVWIDHHTSSQQILELKDNPEFSKAANIWAKCGLVSTDENWKISGCALSYYWMYYMINYGGCTDLYKLHQFIADMIKGKYIISTLDLLRSDSWEIAMKKIMSTNPPMWIQLTDDWDTFKHLMGKSSRYFVSGVGHYGLNEVFLDTIPNGKCPYPALAICEDPNPYFVDNYITKGEEVEEIKGSLNSRIIRSTGFDIVVKHDGKSYDVKVANAIGNSLTFENVIKNYNAVMLMTYDGNQYKYSIYIGKKESDFHCNWIADWGFNMYGITGGGHKNAAGFSSEENIFDTQIIIVNGVKVLNLNI